jgi:hypothetical protein
MTNSSVHDDNLYAPPQSAVIDVVAEQASPQFYVVAPVKCMALFIATLGLYSFYWFWRHWSLYKRRYAPGIWPVPRAIFQVFFTHSLFGKIDVRLKQVDPRYRWSPSALAWLFVIFMVLANLLDRLVRTGLGSPVTDIVSLSTMLPMCYALLQAQKAANAACGDPKGAANAQFTPINYVWLILGLGLWAVTVMGLLTMVPGVME